MEHFTQAVLALVRDTGVVGYWIALFAAFAETALVVGLLIPGSSFLLLMGVLAGQGVLDLGDLLAFAAVGAVLGDNINYFLGRKYGHRWLTQKRWFLKPEYLSRAEGFFDRHGGKSVLLGRFVPSVKELMPFIAGMANMERLPFFVWNLLGAIGWALQWILPGYIFSQSLALAHAWLSRLGLLLFLCVTLIVLLYMLRWLAIRYGPGAAQLTRSVIRSIIEAVRNNPDIAAWGQRHPGLIGFLNRRGDTTRLTGLPMTLIGLAMLYVLLLFGGLVEDLLVREAIVAADARIDSLVASFRTGALNELFYGITTLGNPQVVVAGLLLSMAVLYRLHRTRFVLPMIVSVVAAESLVFLSKLAFHRPRPAQALLEPGGYSFPSGHAAISLAFYGFLFFIVMHATRKWRARVNLLFGAAFLALSIGFSRLYLGVHYLSDVLAGYLLGGLGLLIGSAMVFGGWQGIRLKPLRARTSRSTATVAVVLLGAVWMTVFLRLNAQPPLLSYESAPASGPEQYTGPQQLFSAPDASYALSVTGNRKAPINLVFLATPSSLDSCLQAAGWHAAKTTRWQTVFEAYRDVLLNRGNPAAPMSPWFWNDRTPIQQWSRPDGPDRVFDRSFLRIWRTSLTAAGGTDVLVASTGHERLPSWHLVPEVDAAFDHSRGQLLKQLAQTGGVAGTELFGVPDDKNASRTGLLYEGERSVVRLKACRANMQIKPGK